MVAGRAYGCGSGSFDDEIQARSTCGIANKKAGNRSETATAGKTKCGDLSTAQWTMSLSAASVEMTIFGIWMK
jgi:hypothetical protein